MGYLFKNVFQAVIAFLAIEATLFAQNGLFERSSVTVPGVEPTNLNDAVSSVWSSPGQTIYGDNINGS